MEYEEVCEDGETSLGHLHLEEGEKKGALFKGIEWRQPGDR